METHLHSFCSQQALAQCFTKQVLETTIPLMEMNTPPTEVVGEPAFLMVGRLSNSQMICGNTGFKKIKHVSSLKDFSALLASQRAP